MTLKLYKYDTADYLRTPEDIEAYLEAALEENDPAFFQKALGTVARALGMRKIATQTKTTPAGLYKALSEDGNPEFLTVCRVVDALGYQLTIEKKRPANARTKAKSRRATAKPRAKKAVAKR